MKTFVRLVLCGAFLLLLGTSTLTAQLVSFAAGPSVPLALAGANSGFMWGDVNGDGLLDVLVRQNNILINGTTAFTPLTTANLPTGIDGCAIGFADFNGDGVLDAYGTTQSTWIPWVYVDTARVFSPMTGTGDLANKVDGNNESFGAITCGPIDHTNYLSLVYAGKPSTGGMPPSSGQPTGYGAMFLLKGGSSGFTNVGRWSSSGNTAIDTSLSFESWGISFLDANNDGWQDLLMPSFRNGVLKFNTNNGSGARKGCVLFLNDGTGKFVLPSTTSRFEMDSMSGGVVYAQSLAVKGDTGIIVDDTVRHFAAIAETFGDFNNDGKMDLLLASNGADNMDGVATFNNVVLLYGKGDGTFTYKWDGVHVVPMATALNAYGTYIRGWKVGDYNNDGYLDILTCDGTKTLYSNNKDGTFTDVSNLLTGLAIQFRGNAFVDYNNDGFLDVFTYTGTADGLYMNNKNTNHWIAFRPKGAGHNMAAIGAVFNIHTGGWTSGKWQMRQITSEGDADGQGGDLFANFGLGTATALDSLIVKWPDGTLSAFNGTQMGVGGGVTVIDKYWNIWEGATIPTTVVTARPSWAQNDTSLQATTSFNWNKTSVAAASGTVTYQIQVSTAKTFATTVRDVTISDSITSLKVGLSTKYYWRVRPITPTFTGAWSAIDSLRTRVIACTQTPLTLLPTVGQLRLSIKPTLAVSYVATASTYHLQVDSNATASAFVRWDTATVAANRQAFVLNDSTNLYDTTYAFTTALKANKTYFWRVRGYNPAGNSNWSAVDSFKTMFVPGVPVKVYPSANQPNVPFSNLRLKWNHIDGDSNAVVKYMTYTVQGLVTKIDSVQRDSSDLVASLLPRSKYYWQVQTWNQAGTSAFSAIDSFTTATEVPTLAPVTVYPKGPAQAPRRARYIWNPVANAMKYHLLIATDAGFGTGTVKEDIVTADTSVLIPDTLVAGLDYYWKVSAINAGGEGVYSGVVHIVMSTVVSVEQTNGLPKVFALLQNYPNPFNPMTTIRYDIPKNSYVKINIYDVLGRLVTNLVDGVQSANSYSIQWNASHLSSGMYFYRIHARSLDGSGEFTAAKKLLLVK